METHDVEIASAVQVTREREENGVMTSTYMSSPAANAVIDATLSRIRAGRGVVTAEQLEELDGQQVTLLCSFTNMMAASMVIARPGKIFAAGGVILPKGRRTRGYAIDTSKVVAFTKGYDTDTLAALYDQYSVGNYAPVGESSFAQLPNRGSTCSLAIVTSVSFGGASTPGCLWLCHSYMAEDDIVEGMLVVPEGSGLVSECGSFYGKDLLARSAAVLTDAQPVSFADAINFTNTTEAYTALGL